MNILLYYGILVSILIIGLFIFFIFKRNYFNKYKYIRLVKYNEDMTIDVKYIKHKDFNLNNEILVNPKHVFNFKGYNSIMITSKAQESINPLKFTSKFDAKNYKTAIRSKLIHDTFDTLKTNKIDLMMVLLLISGIQLLAIIYLIYNLLGQVG